MTKPTLTISHLPDQIQIFGITDFLPLERRVALRGVSKKYLSFYGASSPLWSKKAKELRLSTTEGHPALRVINAHREALLVQKVVRWYSTIDVDPALFIMYSNAGTYNCCETIIRTEWGRPKPSDSSISNSAIATLLVRSDFPNALGLIARCIAEDDRHSLVSYRFAPRKVTLLNIPTEFFEIYLQHALKRGDRKGCEAFFSESEMVALMEKGALDKMLACLFVDTARENNWVGMRILTSIPLVLDRLCHYDACEGITYVFEELSTSPMRVFRLALTVAEHLQFDPIMVQLLRHPKISSTYHTEELADSFHFSPPHIHPYLGHLLLQKKPVEIYLAMEALYGKKFAVPKERLDRFLAACELPQPIDPILKAAQIFEYPLLMKKYGVPAQPPHPKEAAPPESSGSKCVIS